MSKFKVAPAAGGYLRRFGVLPSQVTATGPKGHILKEDVFKYAEANKLQMKIITTEAPEASKAPAKVAKKAAPPKKQAAKADTATSPVYNPNAPFQQTWNDQEMASEYKNAAEHLGDAKRTIAHSYMSSKVEVTAIQNDFSGVPIDNFVIKAA